MTTKHTPGPWTFRLHSIPTGGDDYDCGATILDASGKPIADVRETFSAAHEEEQEPNARLIASAPAMLSALEEAVAVLDADMAIHTFSNWAIWARTLVNAARKAKGVS